MANHTEDVHVACDLLLEFFTRLAEPMIEEGGESKKKRGGKAGELTFLSLLNRTFGKFS